MKSFKRGVTEDYRVHSSYMCAILEMSKDDCTFGCSLRGMETIATQMSLSVEQKATIRREYEELKGMYPRSSAIKRILLTVSDGKDFEVSQ